MLKDILSYGIGTLVAFAVVALLFFVFIRDITQKKHSVLRTYPIIGRFRYFFEQLAVAAVEIGQVGRRLQLHALRVLELHAQGNHGVPGYERSRLTTSNTSAACPRGFTP